MVSDIWLRTILIVRKETRCRHICYSYRLTARVLLYAQSHRQDCTYHSLCYTSCGALAWTRNSSTGPPHEGSIRQPFAPWANALTKELHLAPSVSFKTNFQINCTRYFTCTIPQTGWHKLVFVTPVLEHRLEWEIRNKSAILTKRQQKKSVINSHCNLQQRSRQILDNNIWRGTRRGGIALSAQIKPTQNNDIITFMTHTFLCRHGNLTKHDLFSSF